MNLYVYVGNDPINSFDWYGLADCSYYTARCYQNGGTYYGDQQNGAPYWCQWFPSGDPWSDCTRQ